MLTSEEQSDLLNLASNWDSGYTFEVIDGIWKATSALEAATVLTADSADELRQKVRDDYAGRQRAAHRALGDRMSTWSDSKWRQMIAWEISEPEGFGCGLACGTPCRWLSPWVAAPAAA